jgi:hypothetical protein
MEMIAGVECCQDVRRTVRARVTASKSITPSNAPLLRIHWFDGLALLLFVRGVVPLERRALEGVLE